MLFGVSDSAKIAGKQHLDNHRQRPLSQRIVFKTRWDYLTTWNKKVSKLLKIMSEPITSALALK